VRVRNERLDSVRIGENVLIPATAIDAEAFGADDEIVIGRITYVAPGDGPKLRVMFSVEIPK
jgi:hypothetical protein